MIRKSNSILAVALCAISACCCSTVYARSISMEDYNLPKDGGDCTPALRQCLESLSPNDAEPTVINFAPATYHFYPNMGFDEYCFISNNDEGLKRVVFLLKGLHDIEIDGHGSQFIFHGMINPFVITESSNISFKNFSIDCARPFHSEGIISALHDDGVELEIPEEFPYRITNGLLVFTGRTSIDDKLPKTAVNRDEIYPYGHLLEFDTQKKEPAFMARDYFFNNNPLIAEDLGNNKVRVHLKGLTGTIGNTLVFCPGTRRYPAFTASDSRDITFNNVTIYHAGGMGIIGQRVHNVTVDNCKVMPSGNRILSTTADATHFSNCSGKITLANSTFMNQMDDATNIHGIYVRIHDLPEPNKAIVELCHPQQYGFDFIKPDMNMELVKGASLIAVGNAKVADVKRLNKIYTEVTFTQPLSDEIKVGDAMCEARDYPYIHIHDNYVGKNRARGMLLNCRGTTVVENNTFHSPGAAILFEGDASFWFEQGGVSDCTIRNNVFDECLYGVWGQAVIDVAAGIHEDVDKSRYNRNIKIYGNTFRMFDGALLLNAYGVDNLNWKNNKVETTNGYKAVHENPTRFRVNNCDNIKIKQ